MGSKIRLKIYWLGFFAGILYWSIDAFAGRYRFGESDFPAWFLGYADPACFITRLAVFSFFIVFGFSADILIRRKLRDRKEIEWLAAQNELILKSAGEGIFGIDLKGEISFINPAGAHLLGYSELELEGKNSLALANKGNSSSECCLSQLLRGKNIFSKTIRDVFRKKDGSELPVEFFAMPVMEKEKLAGAVLSFKDITLNIESEHKLRARERQQAAVAELGQRALAGADLEELMAEAAILVYLTLDVQFSTILELAPDGNNFALRAGVGWEKQRLHPGEEPVKAGADTPEGMAFITGRPVIVRDFRAGACPFTAGNGNRFYSEQNIISSINVIIPGKRAKPFGVLSAHTQEVREFNQDDTKFLQSIANVLADAFERKMAEEKLWRLSFFDRLTGLPNRLLLNDRLAQKIAHAHKHNETFSVLSIDLDRFKNINDTLGHEMGDMLLKAVGERLSGCLRNEDTVGRLGGDEFIIILSSGSSLQEAAVMTRNIVESVSEVFVINGQELYTTASIGISMYPADGQDTDSLIKNAHSAMYHVKEQDKNGYQFYTSRMNSAAFERLTKENSLRKALERGEFLLYYQPQIDLRTGKLTGLEALIRWRNPEYGMVRPSEFIHIAEETGLILPISEWVLRTACSQNREWQEAGHEPIKVAVNVSMRQFRQKNFFDSVTGILKETGLTPEFLELELTENILLENSEGAIRSLSKFDEMGINLSLDDFGTGYSSLSYLKRLPLKRLKLDRSFVRAISRSPDSEAIIRTIITLAHNLNLRILAEGVETEKQLNFLRAFDCDDAQGYLIGKPAPKEAFFGGTGHISFSRL